MSNVSKCGKAFVVTALSIVIVALLVKTVNYQKREAFVHDLIRRLDMTESPFPKNTVVFVRSGNRSEITVFVKSQIYDNNHPGYYIVDINRQDHSILTTEGWTSGTSTSKEDTSALQNIAMQFSKYDVPRIDVDSAGNIMVYLDDVETLGLIKVFDMNHIHVSDKILNPIEGNWYKCRYTSVR